MKKALNKVFKRSGKRPETGGRITNETIAEHRERVLAGGRKFKYPLQYTKRRVLIMSIIIVVIATIGFVAFVGWQLYSAQGTGQFIYRISQVAPVPVAKVDGQLVRYSDYLLELRSAIHYLTTKEAINFNSPDGKRQLDYQKRLALDKAIQNTYVAKIARENKISVSGREVDDFVKQQISSNRLGVSEDVYKQVIHDYYNWSFDEYKNSVKEQLLRKKVASTIDTEARRKTEELLVQIRNGADFTTLAKASSEDPNSKALGGDIGFQSTKNAEDPHSIMAAAASLQPGTVSNAIEGVDGFYIIKLLEKREHEIHLAKIFISYKELDKRLADLKKNSKIKEYIQVAPLN